jgi:hypothetical protein
MVVTVTWIVTAFRRAIRINKSTSRATRSDFVVNARFSPSISANTARTCRVNL